MRKVYLSGARMLIVLSWLCWGTSPSVAQQPSATNPQQPTATNPQQPAARPGQTPQETPVQPTPVPSPELNPQGRRVEKPPPGFDRRGGDANGQARSLTVEQAIQLALAETNAYRQAQFEERIAAQDVKQARAAFLPQLTMPLTYFGTTPSQLRAPDEPLTFSYVSSSTINETIGLVNAGGEIDISGRLRATLRNKRHLLAAARAGTLSARRALVLETVDAYYSLVLARQRRRLAEETLSLAEGFLKVTEGMMQRGEGEESDVLRARSQVATRRDELEQARAGESAAMDALRVLTGLDFSVPIDVSRIAQDLPTTADFSSYTDEVIKSRPELAQIDAQKRAALEEARVARAERLPQLSYNLNGGFDAADFKPLKRYAGGSATVTLTVPIFDFGASRSREAQARLRAQQLDAQRENAMRQLRQEFYTARAIALSALVRIKETEAGATFAQQNMTLVFARYRAKKATITDVVDAQAAYAEARLAYFQAIIDYRTSRIRLESALGQ
ncbi:MAG TPA: TolC family protein [Pyrinomonadaceae bacterium]